MKNRSWYICYVSKILSKIQRCYVSTILSKYQRFYQFIFNKAWVIAYDIKFILLIHDTWHLSNLPLFYLPNLTNLVVCQHSTPDDPQFRVIPHCLLPNHEIWTFACSHFNFVFLSFLAIVYRLSFNKSFAEMNTSTGEWKYIIGGTCLGLAFAFLIYGFQKQFSEYSI